MADRQQRGHSLVSRNPYFKSIFTTQMTRIISGYPEKVKITGYSGSLDTIMRR
jgi:hypothetical protein